MENLISYTLGFLDIIFKDVHKILESRYFEDATFQEFKRYLGITRYFHIILILLFLIFLIFLTGSLFSGNLKFFGILGGISILFCLFFTWRYSLIFKFVSFKKYKENNCIRWDKWQFKDYIFKKPITINDRTKIDFNYSKADSGFVLYFLCQYPNGHLRWLGFNNQNLSENNFYEKNFGRDINNYIKKPISENMGMYFSKNRLIPNSILGIRIRANVNEKEIRIKNIEFSP